jgi:hypothetical protein
VHIKTADGAVIEQKPGSHAQGSLAPWKFKDGTDQAHEKTAVTDKRDPMYGLSFLIFVAGDKVSQYLIGARLALLFRLERTIPPARFIQFLWQGQGGKILGKK